MMQLKALQEMYKENVFGSDVKQFVNRSELSANVALLKKLSCLDTKWRYLYLLMFLYDGI